MKEIMVFTVLCVLALSCGCVDNTQSEGGDVGTQAYPAGATSEKVTGNVSGNMTGRMPLTRGMGPGNMTDRMPPGNMSGGGRQGMVDDAAFIERFDMDGDGVLSDEEKGAAFQGRGDKLGY